MKTLRSMHSNLELEVDTFDEETVPGRLHRRYDDHFSDEMDTLIDDDIDEVMKELHDSIQAHNGRVELAREITKLIREPADGFIDDDDLPF